MEYKKTQYCEIYASDIISIVGIDNYEILNQWLKKNTDMGESQPQGSGDYYFNLEFLTDEESELVNESYDEDYCPLEIIKIANAISKNIINKMLAEKLPLSPIKYAMHGWV